MQQLLALLRGPYPAYLAVKQIEPKLTLQHLDLVADSTLGKIKFSRSRRNLPMAGDHAECSETFIVLEAHGVGLIVLNNLSKTL